MPTTASLLPPDLPARLSDASPPCISLFQATHRHHPDNLQDPIRFGNLLKSIEASLSATTGSKESGELLEPLRALALDESFWAHTLGGLAVFRAADRFEVFLTQRPLPDLAMVADTFHTKPLRRIQQSLDRYQLLALSRDSVRLFEGDRDVLDEIPVSPEVPTTLTDALGTEVTERIQVKHSPGGAGRDGVAVRYSTGSARDEDALDSERFFRAVDRALLENHSRPSGLPLILAALPEHHAAFRAVSTNPFLAEEAIAIDPGALSVDELRVRAWQLHAPAHAAALSALVDGFSSAAAHGKGSSNLESVITAAREGRVDVLLVETDRQVPGTLDSDSGRFTPGDIDDPGVDDVLDDVADLVETMGGRVVMLPADRMPSDTGIAGTYRF